MLKNNLLYTGAKKRDFVRKITNFILRKILHKRSNDHLLHYGQPVIFAFDYVSNEINIDGVYEIDDLNILIEWISLKAPKIFEGEFIDIGANIGNHSLFFSNYFNRVFSFEANPRTYQVLTINAQLRNNIYCFQAAISDSNINAFLSQERSNMGGSFVSMTPSKSSVPIVLSRLDQYADNFRNIKLIKFDVEGHEYNSILGSKSIIKKYRPIIIFEQHKFDFEAKENKVINLLSTYNYKTFAIIVRSHCKSNSLLLRFGSKILSGSSKSIVICDELMPDFYPFIIAIPEGHEIINEFSNNI
jgi:FkbM family methyltransferase